MTVFVSIWCLMLFRQIGATTMKKISIFISLFVLFISFWSFSARSEEFQVMPALTKKDFGSLDLYFNGVQRSFENGQTNEIQLRDSYRPFYKLDSQQQEALYEWPKSSPNSYAAHLALGIFLKRAGSAARGEKYISETKAEQLEEMERFFTLSRSELNRSLQLAKKPYLTLFHLLGIAYTVGDNKASREFLFQANQLFPQNRLVKNRYMISLSPRWGGSYEQMRQFILENKKEGSDQEGIMQMEAIMYDDLGDEAWRRDDHVTAKSNFLKALELGERIGGGFREDFLVSSKLYICNNSNQYSYCK